MFGWNGWTDPGFGKAWGGCGPRPLPSSRAQKYSERSGKTRSGACSQRKRVTVLGRA
ncbi:MAG: hypothetical protein LC745_00995 [Planctomycetia bacterium]|nr:hypothetical protein [Planctomycetia bacterium]